MASSRLTPSVFPHSTHHSGRRSKQRQLDSNVGMWPELRHRNAFETRIRPWYRTVARCTADFNSAESPRSPRQMLIKDADQVYSIVTLAATQGPGIPRAVIRGQ